MQNPATYLSYDDYCTNPQSTEHTANEDIYRQNSNELQYQEDRLILGSLKFDFTYYNIISKQLPDHIPAVGEVYFYHSDHLGSASWITDHHGNPVQYLQYAPYGEIMLDQHPFGYQERFKFTGKELDKETGYFYFGARNLESYYMTNFTTVDPLADKYIGTQSYAYCNGNPIKYVDPDGMYFDEANEEIAQKIELYVKSRINNSHDGSRRYEFRKTLKDIRAMRKDKDYEYRFIQNDSEEAELYGVNKDNSPVTTSIGDNKVGIFINIKSLDNLIPDETIAHEVRHGGQIARRKLVIDNNCSNYNYKHEIDAYRAQWSWGIDGIYVPTISYPNGQLITNPQQINKSLIDIIIDSEKKLLYKFK